MPELKDLYNDLNAGRARFTETQARVVAAVLACNLAPPAEWSGDREDLRYRFQDILSKKIIAYAQDIKIPVLSNLAPELQLGINIGVRYGGCNGDASKLLPEALKEAGYNGPLSTAVPDMHVSMDMSEAQPVYAILPAQKKPVLIYDLAGGLNLQTGMDVMRLTKALETDRNRPLTPETAGQPDYVVR